MLVNMTQSLKPLERCWLMNKPIKKATGKVALVKPDQMNFKAKVKQAIVSLACYGLLPVALADWLISVGGLTHE